MSDIRQTLLAELEALERSLRDDPRFQKMEAIKSLLGLYDAPQAPEVSPFLASRPVALAPGGAGHPRNKPYATSRRLAPDRERALSEAAGYIRGRPYPTKTAEILEHLTSLGIPVAGNVPLSNLSAMLFHAPEFQTHGRKGWTLASEASDGQDVAEDEDRDLLTDQIMTEEEAI